MGFFNSLKGQVGRDSGRVVSNFVFGNKHATKYQRVDNTKSIAKTLKIEREHELELLEQESRNEIDFLKKKEELKDLVEKKRFVDINLKKIVAMRVPLKKELLVEQLYSLSIEITSNSWKDYEEDINKISNIYTDAVFKKYEQHLFILKSKFPDSTEIPYFEKQYNQYVKKVFLQKYKLLFIGILLVSICGILMFFEEKEKQETPIKDFFKSLTEKIK